MCLNLKIQLTIIYYCKRSHSKRICNILMLIWREKKSSQFFYTFEVWISLTAIGSGFFAPKKDIFIIMLSDSFDYGIQVKVWRKTRPFMSFEYMY